jgi:hypothetical protein
MAAKPSRPKGARAGRVAFGSVGLVSSAAIVMAMGPVWAPPEVSAQVLATPMRAAENAEILATADTESVTPPTTAPPAPTTVPPAPDLIIVEVHRRVPAGAPGAAGTAPVVSDPGSPVTRSAAAAPAAGGAPSAAAPTPSQAQARAAAPSPAAAPAPAAPAPAPRAAPAPAPAPPPPAPAPTAPPRTSSSG